MKNTYLNWLNSIGAATFVIDNESNVIFWNQACEELTGVKSSVVLNTNKHWMGFYKDSRPCLADLVLNDNWKENTELYDEIEFSTYTKRGLRAQNWCHTPAGLKYLTFEANAFYDDESSIQGVIETLRDASKLISTTLELKKLLRAVNHSNAAVYITDTNGSIEFINPKYSEITGYSEAEVLGKTPNILKSGLTDEDVYTNLWQTLKAGEEWNGNLLNKKKDGTNYWSRNSITCVKDDDDEKIINYVAIQEDISHEIEAQEQLEKSAKHDYLTSLLNRREFEQRINILLDKTKLNKSEHALCYVDLDQFKIVNDNCGHMAGDQLLIQLGSVLKESIRNNDTLARLGGDEFGVLIEDCSLKDAHRVASTLQKTIQHFQFSWEGQSFRVGASIGLVAIDESTLSLASLLRQADAACYIAKDNGRNRIHVYYPEDTETTLHHGAMQWVTRIQNALDKDSFCLDAQVIESLRHNNSNTHYEVLIRMVDDNGDPIPPGAFLPAAERYNLITYIDKWVIENTFRLLAAYPAFLNQINLCSINLSGQSIADEKILEFIEERLLSDSIDPEKICFEITETAAISNIEIAKQFISTLKKSGCKFALDDFGSGLSSFGYLKKLPVDYLKIDGIFVKDIVDDPIDRAMVKSINEIGHVMGMQTVAEFVENDEIKGMLREIGADYAQGYGIGKPQSFEKLLNRSA